MSDLLLGIDVGTASTKGVLTRIDGTVVAEAREAHGMHVPRPGWAEQDAESIWWDDVVKVAQALVASVPAGERVGAMGVSAIGPTLLPLDDAGRPLRPAILYGVDTRATGQIAALEARHGREALQELTGHALSSQAVGPKIAWLNEHEPAIAARARWFVTASTYLTYRLTGELAIDAHTASHWNPLFDPRAVAWTDRFADGITEIARLPRIGWASDAIGELSAEAAAVLGLPAGIPVSLGTVDVVAEAISVGVAQPGDLMVMYGSTTFFLLVTDAAVQAEPLWLTAGDRAGRWMIAAGLATGGAAMAWFRDQLARDLVAAEAAGGPNAFSALAAEARAGGVGRSAGDSGGERLLFLPYLSGERTPINDPLARGVLAGLSLHATRGEMYRALLEGIAYAASANLEAMRGLGLPLGRITAVGGGTADRFFLQLVSDASGVEQRLPRVTVGAARGDAFLAGIAAGKLDWSELPGWVDIVDTISPEPSSAAWHRAGVDSARRLYRDTKPIVHELAGGETS